MTQRIERARAELSEAARAIAEGGLVGSSSGNLSVRLGQEMLITPRQARLDAIDPASCVRVAISDGALLEAERHEHQPSSETPLHLAVYRSTDARAVAHTHSMFATALSTVAQELPAIHYLVAAFGGPVRVAPYATFGSWELAENVTAALRGRRAALLANHGAVVYAESLERAVDLARQLEWLCELYLTAAQAGRPALLDERELERVAARSRTLRYGITGEG